MIKREIDRTWESYAPPDWPRPAMFGSRQVAFGAVIDSMWIPVQTQSEENRSASAFGSLGVCEYRFGWPLATTSCAFTLNGQDQGEVVFVNAWVLQNSVPFLKINASQKI